MPQFDFSQAMPQVVWLTIVFAILYIAVHALLPRVGRVVENRKARIAADLAEAETARAAAAEAASGGNNVLADARGQALDLLGSARDAAAKATAAKLADVDARLEAEALAAEQTLAGQRQTVLAELDAVAGEVTADLVRRVASIDISADAALAAVRKVAA